MKVKFLGLALLAAIFALSGCTQIRQLHERMIIQGIGVDKVGEGYEVSVQVFDTKGGPDTGEEKEGTQVIASRGRSVFEALSGISKQTGKDPLYSQNLVLIIGESAARYGVDEVIDFFCRHYEARPSVEIFISESKARDVIGGDAEEDITAAKDIASLAQTETLNSNVLSSSVLDFVGDLQSDIADPHAVYLSKTKSCANKTISTNGTAIFSGAKMAGTLTPSESRGALLISGKIKNGTEVIDVPGIGKVTYTIMDSLSETKTRIVGGKPVFDISISANASVYEISPLMKNSADEDYFLKLKTALNTRLASIANQAINKALFECSCDIFNFARILRRQNTEYFKSVQEDCKAALKDARYNLSVDAAVKRIGQEVNPL